MPHDREMGFQRTFAVSAVVDGKGARKAVKLRPAAPGGRPTAAVEISWGIG
jgi:hypothetical protein